MTDDWGRLSVTITLMWSPGLQSETELPGEGLFLPLEGPTPPNPSRQRERVLCVRGQG